MLLGVSTSGRTYCWRALWGLNHSREDAGGACADKHGTTAERKILGLLILLEVSRCVTDSEPDSTVCVRGGESLYTTKPFARHQLGAREFNSVPTRSSWRFHGLRIRSCKTAPPPLSTPVVSLVCYLCFSPTGCKSCSHKPLCGLDPFARVVHRTQETFYLLGLLAYYKRIEVRKSQMKETQRVRSGDRDRGFQAFSRCGALPLLLSQPEALVTQSFWVFMETSSHGSHGLDQLNHR